MPKLKMRRLHGLARNQQSVLLCALVYIYFKSKEYSYGFSVPLLYINQVAQQKQHLILIISKSLTNYSSKHSHVEASNLWMKG